METECEGDVPCVQCDLDGDLLAKFSCLGTTDRDVLVHELHSLLGAQLSREGCEFFLEIGNWNLQAAVGAYYDFYGPVAVLPTMAVEDVTLSPGQCVPPNTALTKIWRITNTGSDVWQSGTSLTLLSRNTLCGPTRVQLPSLRPGQETEVSVNLLSPSLPGMYQSIWRLTTPTGGACAGQCVCAVVRVGGCEEEMGQEGELAMLTQQLAAFSTSDRMKEDDCVGSSPPPPSPVNSSPAPAQSHTSLLSHSPFPSTSCEMEEQQPSSFHHP